MMKNLLRTLCLSLLLAACGGGVETGGTGPTGSALTEGPIAGFGSIVVGGVRFDDRAAQVIDAEDRVLSRDALRLGMVVEVQSDRPVADAGGNRSANAVRVRLGGSLLGPLMSIGLTESRLVVLGQTVRLTPSTIFDGVSGGVAGLALGDVLEVHGFPGPGGLLADLVATRIERRSTLPTSFRVRGAARELNLGATPPTLRLGALVFDLSGLVLPTGLVDGAIVRLTVATAAVDGRWPASAIAVESRRLDDRDEAEIEGLVSAFTSTTAFSVNGVPVDATGASFPDGVTGLALGARVEVEGRLVGGVLVASEVELRSDDEVRDSGIDLRGTISALDRVARTFVVRGITIHYGTVPPPEYDDGSEADLADGRCVRVRAVLDADRTRVLARRIEFDNDCNP